MDFNEFKKKYFKKDFDSIKNGIKNEENFFKENIDMVKLCVDAGVCADSISNIEKDFPALFSFKKRYIIMLYILKNLTTIELIPEDESFEDYDILVEKAILELNSDAYFFKSIVEDSIAIKQNSVLDELYNTFSKKLPTTEDIQKMKEQLDNMFSNESPEKLNVIKDILEFNDPSLKQIKDIVYNPELEIKNIKAEKTGKIEKKEDNNKNNIVDIAQKTVESANKVSEIIQSNPIVENLNNELKQKQKERVLEYNNNLQKDISKNN